MAAGLWGRDPGDDFKEGLGLDPSLQGMRHGWLERGKGKGGHSRPVRRLRKEKREQEHVRHQPTGSRVGSA